MLNHEDSEETPRNEIANCLAGNGEPPNLQARDRTLNLATAPHPKISKQIENTEQSTDGWQSRALTIKHGSRDREAVEHELKHWQPKIADGKPLHKLLQIGYHVRSQTVHNILRGDKGAKTDT